MATHGLGSATWLRQQAAHRRVLPGSSCRLRILGVVACAWALCWLHSWDSLLDFVGATAARSGSRCSQRLSRQAWQQGQQSLAEEDLWWETADKFRELMQSAPDKFLPGVIEEVMRSRAVVSVTFPDGSTGRADLPAQQTQRCSPSSSRDMRSAFSRGQTVNVRVRRVFGDGVVHLSMLALPPQLKEEDMPDWANLASRGEPVVGKIDHLALDKFYVKLRHPDTGALAVGELPRHDYLRELTYSTGRFVDHNKHLSLVGNEVHVVIQGVTRKRDNLLLSIARW